MNIILRTIEILLGLLGIATISVGVFLWQPSWSPFQEPTFRYNVIPGATMVAAWTTLLVAYAAFRTIRTSNEKEKRNRKAQVLDDVSNWLIEIYTIPLTMHMPTIKSKRELENFKINELNKYGVGISESTHIRAIVKENFNEALLGKIDECRYIVTQLSFIKGKAIGIDLKVSFRGELLTKVEEIEKEITEGKETIDQLFKRYASDLATSIVNLENEIARIKANLLK